MKKAIVAATGLLLAVQAFAQTQISLDLGSVTVWLGMPKRDALDKLSSAGYKVEEWGTSKGVNGPLPDDKRLVVINKTSFPVEESWRNVYSVSFTAGHLTYADRSWFDEKDPLASVVEAFGALTDQGSRACTVTYSPISSPGSSAKRVWVTCGRRSVLILRGEYEYNGRKNPHFEVSERIGNSPQ